MWVGLGVKDGLGRVCDTTQFPEGLEQLSLYSLNVTMQKSVGGKGDLTVSTLKMTGYA